MEREQVALLYETYGDDVYRLALSFLGSRQDAEDICQNVFLKLFDKEMTLLPEKEKAWLLTCTSNACKNHLRFCRRRNAAELDETIPFQEQSDRELWDAVMKLPPKYRAVIHLFYYEGYGQAEIAAILRISLTAVQTRMARARQMLRKELGDNERTV